MKLILSKSDKPKRKFIEVNCSWETLFMEVGQDVLGAPSTMRTNNLAKRKASNRWCVFHEDFGHLIKDCISLKVYVDNHIQKGKSSKHKKEPSSLA